MLALTGGLATEDHSRCFGGDAQLQHQPESVPEAGRGPHAGLELVGYWVGRWMDLELGEAVRRR